MKIAILQLNFMVGDVEGNTDKIIKAYRQVCSDKPDLVVSTELGLLGYPPQDLLFRRDYLERQYACLNRLKQLAKEIPLIVGIAESNQFEGKALYNSASAIINHEAHSFRKVLLPTYDVFDERRYFQPGNLRPNVFYLPNGNLVGVLICEDIWGGTENPYGKKLYPDDPVEALRAAYGGKLDALVTLNASPYYWGKGDARLAVVRAAAAKLLCPVVYANQVGGNTELVFDGRSFAVDRTGNCLACAQAFEERIMIVDTEGYGNAANYPTDAGNLQDLYSALVLGTADYAKKTGFDKTVIALSGGIDSALTAVIAVDALVAGNVLGVSMPSEYSSRGSIDDARTLADNLGIEFKVMPIGGVYNAYGRALNEIIGWYEAGSKQGDATEENVQARIRGNLIMAISNRERRLVLTTGNKSELAVGYCTLYGDMAGGFGVISDVPKTLVYQLAHRVNSLMDIIPSNTIRKPPSAELRPGQKDTDSLPPYDILDKILKLYIEEEKSLPEIVEAGYNTETVKDIIKMVNGNEYKRRQGAPGIKVSPRAFGSGRRMPIAARFL